MQQDILSTSLNNQYTYASGSSFSAPFLSASICLMKFLFLDPGLDLKTLLKRYSTKVPQPHPMDAGILNIRDSVIHAISGIESSGNLPIDNSAQIAIAKNAALINQTAINVQRYRNIITSLAYTFVAIVLFMILCIIFPTLGFFVYKYKNRNRNRNTTTT